MKIIDFLSPNYDKKIRKKKSIKSIVIHYTGMQSERESLVRLCNFKSKVSCHYLINRKGKVFRLVKDQNVAWHAGESCWAKYISLNKNSIGIELVNRGHKFGYTDYSSKQISELVVLCNFLIKKYQISKKNIVGHSDVAPLRKIDPGEKFPWKYLSAKKIGIWHSLDKKKLKKDRGKKIKCNKDKMDFIKDIKRIGYCVNRDLNKVGLSKVVKAFQSRFRQALVNGQIDLECLKIASNLSKKS